MTDLKDLAFFRSMKEKQLEWVKAAQERLDATPEARALRELKAELEGVDIRLKEIDTQVRADLVTQFLQDGNKHPIEHVEIKDVTVVTVKDEKAAMLWAAQNAPKTLSLNMTKFTPAVKNLELPFVEVGIEPKVYIDSDLSELLNQEKKEE